MGEEEASLRRATVREVVDRAFEDLGADRARSGMCPPGNLINIAHLWSVVFETKSIHDNVFGVLFSTGIVGVNEPHARDGSFVVFPLNPDSFPLRISRDTIEVLGAGREPVPVRGAEVYAMAHAVLAHIKRTGELPPLCGAPVKDDFAICVAAGLAAMPCIEAMLSAPKKRTHASSFPEGQKEEKSHRRHRGGRRVRDRREERRGRRADRR